MGNKPPKICFVEALAYPVLSGDKRHLSTGGESVQHTLLARAFAELGWQVSMISRDFGQEDGTVVDGVQVWKTYVQKAGLPYIRFVHPRLTSIWRALKQADADVYFQSCAGLMTGAVARFAASRGRHMIFRAAHDTDFMPGEELIKNDRDRHFDRESVSPKYSGCLKKIKCRIDQIFRTFSLSIITSTNSRMLQFEYCPCGL